MLHTSSWDTWLLLILIHRPGPREFPSLCFHDCRSREERTWQSKHYPLLLLFKSETCHFSSHFIVWWKSHVHDWLQRGQSSALLPFDQQAASQKILVKSLLTTRRGVLLFLFPIKVTKVVCGRGQLWTKVSMKTYVTYIIFCYSVRVCKNKKIAL